MRHSRSIDMKPSASIWLLALLALSVVAVSCDSSSSLDDGVARDVSIQGGPPAAFLRADGRSAEELLSASDLAMQQIDRLTVGRMIQYEDHVEEDVLLLSPAAYWLRGEKDGSLGSLWTYANRSAGGLWVVNALASEISRGVTGAQDVRLIGETQENGRDAWVIWYWFVHSSVERPFPAWRTEWIAKDDLRLLRQVQDDGDPLGQRARIESVLPHP